MWNCASWHLWFAQSAQVVQCARRRVRQWVEGTVRCAVQKMMMQFRLVGWMACESEQTLRGHSHGKYDTHDIRRYNVSGDWSVQRDCPVDSDRGSCPDPLHQSSCSKITRACASRSSLNPSNSNRILICLLEFYTCLVHLGSSHLLISSKKNRWQIQSHNRAVKFL